MAQRPTGLQHSIDFPSWAAMGVRGEKEVFWTGHHRNPGDKAMNCLRCDREMREEDYEEVPIDRCPGCQGIWLDRIELLPILDRREEQFGVAERAAFHRLEEAFHREEEKIDLRSDKFLHCPVCSERMSKTRYPYAMSIVIDRCKKHGIWLDKGEIDLVQIAIEETEKDVEKFHEEHGPELAARREKWRAEMDAAREEGKAEFWQTQKDFLLGLITRPFRGSEDEEPAPPEGAGPPLPG